MTDVNAMASPTASAERNHALDVMRGIAVFGIFACNIWFFANPITMMTFPGMIGTEKYQMEAFKAFIGFLDGTQRGLFSIMFGAGTVLLMERLTAKGLGIRAADIYFRRTVLLLLFGLVNAWVFMWHGDILYHYAIVSFLVFALRKTKIKILLMVVLALMLVETGKKALTHMERTEQAAAYNTAIEKQENGAELTAADNQAIGAYGRLTDYEPRIRGGNAEIERVRSGFEGSYAVRARWNKLFESVIFYDFFFIDVLLMMLMGVVLYRKGWLTNERSKADYAKVMLVGLAIGWTLRYLRISAVYTATGTDPLAVSFWGMFQSLDRVALTLGYMALIQLVVKMGVLGWLFKGFAAAGRMALSNYLMQSIICAFLFLGFGFGLYGQLRGIEHYYVVLAVMVASILWSVWWLKHYRFGPFEWLWRSLTYGKKQPMKR